MMRVTEVNNGPAIEKMLRSNGQYLITVHNGHIVKVQSVAKPDESPLPEAPDADAAAITAPVNAAVDAATADKAEPVARKGARRPVATV